jgi:hypothetical protein
MIGAALLTGITHANNWANGFVRGMEWMLRSKGGVSAC